MESRPSFWQSLGCWQSTQEKSIFVGFNYVVAFKDSQMCTFETAKEFAFKLLRKTKKYFAIDDVDSLISLSRKWVTGGVKINHESLPPC
jgi:hypothetical protein